MSGSPPVYLGSGLSFILARSRIVKKKEKASNPLEDSAAAREIAALIREIQPTLTEYSAGMLGGATGADDVVQETNLFLWEHRDDFELGTNFRAWALRVARFKVLAARRDRDRNQRLLFSDELLEQFEEKLEDRTSGSERRLRALSVCLSRIRLQDRRLLDWKYIQRAPLSDLARDTGKRPNALHKKISRIRLALRHCIEKTLSKNS